MSGGNTKPLHRAFARGGIPSLRDGGYAINSPSVRAGADGIPARRLERFGAGRNGRAAAPPSVPGALVNWALCGGVPVNLNYTVSEQTPLCIRQCEIKPSSLRACFWKR
jgi:hypothetical protein